jgi:hypothetical protein
VTRPIVSKTAEEIYAGLIPWTDDDEALDWPLLKYVDSITRDLDVLNTLVRDSDERPGWSLALDVDAAPKEYLPYLAQFFGVSVDQDLSEADQREQIKETARFKRGTLKAILSAARPYLTGSKAVGYIERYPDPYHLYIATFTEQTTDPAKVLAALMSQKPAGLIIDYNVLDGLPYANLTVTGHTYGQLSIDYPTYSDMTHWTF